MATQSSLESFNPAAESIEDYKERFDFHCTAHQIPEGRRKALFLTRIGCDVFAKLKTVVSPTPLNDLSLSAIVTTMTQHYKKDTVEIAERFKFFKRVQQEKESVADYVAELRRLSKTCNFGDYLETALRDQVVCGLCELTTQKELLCVKDLTLSTAIDKARAAETVNREVKNLPTDAEALKISAQQYPCPRCGRQGHTKTTCYYRNKRCRTCNRLGHASAVCWHTQPQEPYVNPQQKRTTTKQSSKPTYAVVARVSDSDEEEFDNNQLAVHKASSRHTNKLTTVLQVEGIALEMEVDTGAELSTIPAYIYQQKLHDIKLHSSSVCLHQYDGSTIPVKGEIKVVASTGEQSVAGSFIIVDIKNEQLPLLGRDWLLQLRLDWPKLLQYRSLHQVQHKTLQEDFPSVFKEELGLLLGMEADIELKEGAKPKFCKSRPVPFALREKVEEAIRQQVADGELEPVDHSLWAAPIVIVTKKNGDIRICADFKVTVNPQLCVQTFPLPTPDEIFSVLANGESFSKIDLARAYKQMRVAKGSQPYLTINTPLGLYRYLRLPFGIASAPAIWQKAMTTVLQGCKGVVYYLDDILITGTTREEHVQNLRNVMARLQKFGLRVNASKCKYFQPELEFLGHVITPLGIRPTNQRIKDVLQAPIPTNKSELKSFLGLMTYNAKFISSVASLLHPLYQLLRKDSHWNWSAKCQDAFDKAKTLVSQAPVLVHYDVNKPIKLYCDASARGVGACLMHVVNGEEKPVAYASRTLSPAEVNYAHIEREALAIIFGVKRFNQYLYGREFILVTDHRPLCKLFGHADGVRPLAAARMQRWAMILSAYSYKIQYVPGPANQCADCLSRLPVQCSKIHPAEEGNAVHAMHTTTLPVTAMEIASQTAKDKILSRVCTYVQHNSWPFSIPEEIAPFHRKKEELTLSDGCLLWGKRVIVPSKLQPQLLAELHFGHIGICRMKSLARSFIWWPGLDNAIEKLTNDCEPCKVTATMPPPVARHPWQHPNAPWERVHIDYGEWHNHHFLVLVDAFSKWPEVKLVTSTTSHRTITILSDIFAMFGFPQMLVSDNAPQFVSTEFEDFLRQNHIIHRTSPPYHPSTNGIAENMVKNVKYHLKKQGQAISNVHQQVADFLRTYRNVPHSTTNLTPAHLMLAQAPRTHLAMTLPHVANRVKQQLIPKPIQTQVRKFTCGDHVMVRDFRPTLEKWQKGTIIKVLGGLSYQVDCGGHVRQVHIDHLIPAASTLPAQTKTSSEDIPPSPPAESLSLPVDPPTSSILLPHAIPVPTVHRSARTHRKPQRLIEELN